MSLEDKTYFIKQLELLDNEKNSNILDQLPSYNINDTQYLINNLEQEYEQQKTLNMILTHKDFDKEIVNITRFIKDNNIVINKQLNKLTDISRNLKKVIKENKKLQEKRIDLEELLNNEYYNNIANKLKLIKKEKESIKFFLQKNGISLV